MSELNVIKKIQSGNREALIIIGEEDVSFLQERKETIISYSGFDWDTYLSPWPAERVFKKGNDFSGKADDMLEYILHDLEDKDSDYENITLAGYSLAGLFALYCGTKTDRFDNIVSASGSMWFEGWLDYLKEHPVHAKKVYLSLGDQEKKTKNPRMALVEENTKEVRNLISSNTECIFEMNPGNHFFESDKRLLKGIVAVKDKNV